MVTIAFTSDLHMDASEANAALVPHLARAVEELEPDLFVLAGDVGGGAVGVLEVLEAFRPLPVPKLFVPGNHDLWTEARGPFVRYRLDSATKYNELLPALCDAAGWHYLPAEPFSMNGVGLAGAMGWYDYSLRNRSLDGTIPRRAYRLGRFGRLVWNDSLRVRWPKRPGRPGWRERSACVSDEALLDGQLSGLEGDLARLEAGGVSSIVAVTHFLPGPELIEYTGIPEGDFAWGFAGSRRLGELLGGQSAVRALICGHTHRTARGASAGLPVHLSPVGLLERCRGWPPSVRARRPAALEAVAKERVGLLRIES